MSPEVQARIFEPFFTTKEPGKGTGLGLATVHGIVKQSHGQIEVESTIGKGTAFRIYLPRCDEIVVPRKSAQGVALPGRGSETILLVEDDAGVRELACLVLRTSGFAVLEAADGDEALRRAAEHPGPIHLLLTDVVLPRQTGRQVAELLRPHRPRMKVLYCSGYTDDAIVRQGIQQAEVAFLRKPYSPALLVRKVREALDQPE
jgi:CheY-like chemotaxis protein